MPIRLRIPRRTMLGEGFVVPICAGKVCCFHNSVHSVLPFDSFGSRAAFESDELLDARKKISKSKRLKFNKATHRALWHEAFSLKKEYLKKKKLNDYSPVELK